MKFHHLGIACKNIEAEIQIWEFLGYKRESEIFIDEAQKIKGIFLVAPNQPRVELLENFGGEVLDNFLRKRNKIYHYAYESDDIEKDFADLKFRGAVEICPIVDANYFSRVCFAMASNNLIIELVEPK